MRWAIGICVVILAALAGWFVWLQTSELTECFVGFESREQAERAAAIVEDGGFDADVEAGGPGERRPTSEWGRRIGVRFSDGATGEDAEPFEGTVQLAVDEENGITGRRGVVCSERPRIN